MPREIKMPKLSDTMEEGTINVWRKGVGDEIAKGDVLLEIETDKADMEFEAYMAGSLAKVLVEAGETVSVGTPIAVVRLERDGDDELKQFLAKYGDGAGSEAEAPGDDEEEAEQEPPKRQAKPERETPKKKRKPPAERKEEEEPAEERPSDGPFAPAELPQATSRLPFFLPDPDRVRATPRARALAREQSVDLSEIAGSGPEGAVLVPDVERYLEALQELEEPLEGDVPVTPVAARIAAEHGVDLSQLKGSGPGGRVTKRDIREHLEQGERSGREQGLFGDAIKLSQKRKFLIRQMVESKQNVPHFYISMDVDAEPLRAMRERLKGEGRHITYTHMILKAAALALEEFPEANALYRDDQILPFRPINIAVAVDVKDELVAPVVKDCQGVALEELAGRTDALIQKARERKLAPEDYADGTFTISNLGMLGVDHFYAIITPPQSLTLSVGGVREVPVATPAGAIEIGRRIDMGLACDHRVLDGAKAARVLDAIKRGLEDPIQLLESLGG